MTVDFNGIGQGQVNSKTSANTGKAATPAPEAPQEQAKAQATRSDSVSLSSQARDLKKLEERLDSYPEVDDARVEQIKAALADGSYKIDAEQLAQKMLDMDNSIFG
ncbi:MAG: flagellar biosynthesis anti-sigma factor FlgM [Alteromonadaceae bacterium]|uniref:flagellar biosynthesis anti-sigma factor FlgM n=1 Tax=unclassified Marinobacter TaxID=83889 RepID=UPI000C610C23|nr:flagellar biosynthesis anti-sigma factor FlgM [Marinobacter sp. BGYM27]MAA63972.1 flagellar biosynthesis anti-sigma factor FlgM [Alteromonadaceae bacterium]MBH85746.1 flagellar biosynthesis anti-sigma factor FlgM [Alteromonadaceae bacterium]MDG5500362.1 flagellar biosynthesis anti-sigma factor FlgM [Marinobacter sp. BGYM27]|tara:strand:+ start:1623 stop:1940 length:318 start_codon:yes stop_codon:yes gene_type:complete